MLDTRSISFGAGILAVWAATQLEEGRSFDELKEMLPKRWGIPRFSIIWIH